jgi:dimethylamine monooxygenase subunit A
MHTLTSTTPPARYFPFASGQYTTAPGLHKLTTDFGNGEADQRIFQIDAQWPLYFQNKGQCREESIGKYFKSHQLKEKTTLQLTQFIIHQLLSEYPSVFNLEKQQEDILFTNRLTQETVRFDQNYALIGENKYVSALDALASQVQEDMAVWQREEGTDRMVMIHLCAPNHWSPAEKIGKPFSVVHQPVADMERMRQRYQPMLKTLIRGGSFVRFAWGLSTDNRLNHHPVPPPGWKIEDWQGRHFDPDYPSLYVRVERQTISGFPEADVVLFTIRTYFEEVRKLESVHRRALLKALNSMSPEALEYKGLSHKLEILKIYLNQ